MPIKVYRTRKFSTTHENKIFDQLIEKLKEKWEDSEELILLLGNFYCKGNELDAAIIKKDSISVVDFKDYGGNISFSENSKWKANETEIKFENRKNPYIQIKDNKFALLNYLKEKQLFEEGNHVNLGHISGIIMFHQKIQFENSSLPPSIKSWFHVTDIFNIVKLLNQITSREINLNNKEIKGIADDLGLEEYMLEKPVTDIKEDEFIGRKELIDELSKLIDILSAIDIAQSNCNKLVERHDEFIRQFFPNNKPEKQMNYNLNTYYNSFKKLQKEFIDIQKSNLNKQVDIIYNLNTNNGVILNEFIKEDDIKKSLQNRNKTIQIIHKLRQKYKINYQPNRINTNILDAYKVCLYGRGIFDELPFIQLKNEFTKKECLLNNLHAIYVVSRFWFADDMIKHGLEQERKEVEHVYARGFSPKWLKNIKKKLNNGNPLSIKFENMHFFTSQQEEIIRKYPEQREHYSKCSIDIIIEVEIPVKIQHILAELVKNLNEVLTKNELDTILDFFNLHWIKKKSISIHDIVVIDLKTHLIFNLEKDFDFLVNKQDSNQFYYFPNRNIYEPIYLTFFEEVGISTLDTFENNKEFQNSYKTLSQNLVDQIDEVINAWSIYKSTNWYYTYDDYYFNNRLNIGSRDNGVDYKGTNVSKELLITPEQLKKYLNNIQNKKLFGGFHYTGIGDRYYIRALKHFKRLSLNEESIKKEVTDNNKKRNLFRSSDQKEEIKPNDQIIIGYDDIRKYIERRLEPYKNPEETKQFGLKKTAGIILYGPPGCGKTYWANWIADYLKLPFEEVFRSHIGSSFVDGAMKELDKKLTEIEKKSPIAIFFDEFDSIGKARNNNSSSGEENRKVVNTLLQRIPKLIDNNIVVLAATNFINDLDSAVIRPGRFNLHIPIFPPLPEERAEILLYNLLNDSSSAISAILIKNYANEKDYWEIYTEKMYLFSNSHVLDFCNEFREQLYIDFKKNNLDEIIFSDELIIDILNTVKAKIRSKDVELYIKFYQESNNLKETFKKRMDRLKYEIDNFSGENDNYERRPIGFR